MHFPSDYEEFIFKSRYARWLDNQQRREDWPETVERYFDFIRAPLQVRPQVLNFDVMPSMRALMTAGPALDRDNTAGFNCSFLPVDHPLAFDEAMYILLCGTGVGFSVERMFTEKLPIVAQSFVRIEKPIVVDDSKEGWALSMREHIDLLFRGYIAPLDTSLVREAGARLKTFGGRASGPEPLIELYEFLIKVFQGAAGRQLTPLECHDIMCFIGQIVVVGGVRRSAMISLSDLDDEEMAKAKSGEWWIDNPQRALANISAVYNETPGIELFSKEWNALVKSRSGERGIFNRAAAIRQAMKNGRRQVHYDQVFRDGVWCFDGPYDPTRFIPFGTNPCSEIILRPYQFCNLTEVICRAEDSLRDLKKKVEGATILGTYQACLTDFPYLRPIWRENTEDERLLGVSLTGIMDHPVLNGSQGTASLIPWLRTMRAHAVEVNKLWAAKIGIKQATAVTCVKPSGTVSQLTNAASGIHSRFAPYYIRTVRGDNKDPITQFMKDQGVPHEPCVMRGETTTVFSFPIKAPEGAITRHDRTAIYELEHWLLFQEHWCEHKPSVTISVRDDEWAPVGRWVLDHFADISGVSFLPYDGGTYQQAPYQEVDWVEWTLLKLQMPAKIDWTKLDAYETEDNTKGAQTLACSSGVCEIVDL